jgi:trigger factor
MRTSIEPLEGNKVKLSVEVEEHELEKAVDAAFRRLRGELRLPGFRPGKAPRRLIEARIGKDGLRQEALRDALPDFYAQAVREADLDAIAPPEIDITSGADAGDLVFDAVVEVRPHITVPGYTGLRVEIPSPVVTDDEIERQIDRLRRSSGELEAVARPARDGDHVTIDIRGSRDGDAVEGLTAEDYVYEIGSGGIVDQLDAELNAAKVGDIREFTANVGDDEVTFRVLVKETKELVLPEVTDEWAQEASEFETADELRADIRTRIEGLKKMQANLAIRDHTLEALNELVTDDVPAALVDGEVERRLHDLAHRLAHQGANVAQYLEATGQTEEQLIASLRGASEAAVQSDLALRAVAEAEGLEVTEADIDDEIARAAEEAERDVFEIRAQLERGDQMPAVRSDLRKAKALKWLVDNVEVVDEDGKPVDRAQLTPDLDDDTSEGPSEETDVEDVE